MKEEAWRNLAAQQAAQSYLIGWLLRFSLMRERPEVIREISEYIKEQARSLPESMLRASREDGAASSDLADMIVKMYEYVDSLVDHASNETIDVLGTIGGES